MSSGWENHEPAPLEFFHGKMMELFHEFRRSKVGENINVEINGGDFSNIIAKAKLETYAKYPNQVNSNAILKTEV